MGKSLLYIIIALVVLAAIGQTCSAPNQTRSNSGVNTTHETTKTVEEKMAIVDGNYPLSVKIARYRYLLTALEEKTGDSKERIGDMSVKAQDILRKEYGKEVTLLELLEGVNKAIPAKSNVPYANVIAAYIMLIGQ